MCLFANGGAAFLHFSPHPSNFFSGRSTTRKLIRREDKNISASIRALRTKMATSKYDQNALHGDVAAVCTADGH